MVVPLPLPAAIISYTRGIHAVSSPFPPRVGHARAALGDLPTCCSRSGGKSLPIVRTTPSGYGRLGFSSPHCKTVKTVCIYLKRSCRLCLLPGAYFITADCNQSTVDL